MPIDKKTQQMLLDLFKVELQEIQQSLITTLLSLEKIKTINDLELSLKELFRYSHNIKGAAASASIPAISSIAHGLEDLFQVWREKTHFPTREEINACLEVADNLLSALNQYNRGEAIDVENFLAPLNGGKVLMKIQEPHIHEFIKLPLNRIERTNAKVNEFIVYRIKLINWFKQLELCLKEINDLPELKPFSPLIDKMHSLSTERGLFLGEFSRAIQGLQDELKAMRMLPVSTLLTPLSRTVHDISATLNKYVELEVYGGDIELDKPILDAIKDPLQHLIRNAIDHGIEETHEREKAKKSVPAKLRIEVTQSSGKIIIKVIDDGRGIDIQQVEQHAIATGLYSKSDLKSLRQEQILDCIFTSGFSLHKNVTEISGRGIGLDVVKNDLQKIKATISVSTEVNQGSCFTLILPLTLATTRGVFFKLINQTFMIPTLSLKSLYSIKTQDLKLINNQLSYVINNKPIPFISLNYILTKRDDVLEPKHTYFGLFIDYPGVEFILWVDTILDEHECVIKPMPSPFTQLAQYIGLTHAGDGSLVLVLEPNKLIEMTLATGPLLC